MSVIGLGVKVLAPTGAPTIVQGSATGSLSGNYIYAITFLTGFGETTIGTSSGSTAITGSASLTAIPLGGPNVIRRNIYRTVGGGSSLLYVTTITDNVTTSYSDSLADGSLGVAPPVYSTSDSLETMNGFFAWDKPQQYSIGAAITATTSNGPILTNMFNNISVSPSGGQVQLIPLTANLIGMRIIVKNNGSNPVLIVPNGSQTINSLANLALGVGGFVEFSAASATNWLQMEP